ETQSALSGGHTLACVRGSSQQLQMLEKRFFIANKKAAARRCCIKKQFDKCNVRDKWLTVKVTTL
ncbi:hypothetical protein LD597_17850, partial [Salmonella enterica]|nr:hypothetical protein [Salmonella enterica]